jgi:hypothetical protein
MGAQTANHSPRDLKLAGVDDINETVTFTARSASQPGRVNTVTLALKAGEISCDCIGAEKGERCWHQSLARKAWDLDPIRAAVRTYSDDELCAAGRWAANRLRVYRRRRYALPIADLLTVCACRDEFRQRNHLAAGGDCGSDEAA